MFDFVAYILASVASFLFPLYASYKALKTSDPSQLTPWLMYWSVLSCALLAETWTSFILVWIPFYAWIRLGFVLWLVLPSTQGSRVLYETYLYPYLQENETAIEQFIARAHDRLKAEGIRYIQHLIELIRTQVLNLPPSEKQQESPNAMAAPQGYMQALLNRFSMPVSQQGTKNSWPMNFAYTGPAGSSMPEQSAETPVGFFSLAEQRDRLAAVLSALDSSVADSPKRDNGNFTEDLKALRTLIDRFDPSRPSSEHSVGSPFLSKSRSEVDFEKIDAPSGSEADGSLHKRGPDGDDSGATRGGWSIFGWGAGNDQTRGQSTGFQRE